MRFKLRFTTYKRTKLKVALRPAGLATNFNLPTEMFTAFTKCNILLGVFQRKIMEL